MLCGLPLYDSESWLSVTVCFVICLCVIQRTDYMSLYVMWSASVWFRELVKSLYVLQFASVWFRELIICRCMLCGLPLYDSESWLSVTVCFVICLCLIQRADYMLLYVMWSASVWFRELVKCHHMFCNLPLFDSESWLYVAVCYVVCLCMIQRAG